MRHLWVPAPRSVASRPVSDDTSTADPVRQSLDDAIGQPLGSGGPSLAPDAVNLPMIRHWVDALDDRNPVYLDEELAATTRFGALVAPPAMLQTWTMARPRIEGIAERGGAAMEVSPDSPLGRLAAAGYTATLATNSELEFVRYLRIGDQLSSLAVLEAVSEQKVTSLGTGYFVTWVTDYRTDDGEVVGRQRFRVFRFAPGSPTTAGADRRAARPAAPDASAEGAQPNESALPAWELNVTATVVVAGAIASRDFMPAHHDREYARAQGAPDHFMNILTTNGYLSRYVTDWAGPEAVLERIAVRLGAPSVPGHPMRFDGSVRSERRAGDERRLEIAVQAVTDLGAHATGTVVLTLPADA
jgi:acyl dehydratase